MILAGGLHFIFLWAHTASIYFHGYWRPRGQLPRAPRPYCIHPPDCSLHLRSHAMRFVRFYTRPLLPHMSPPRAYSFPIFNYCRKCSGAARHSTFRLPTLFSANVHVTVRLRHHNCTMPPLPADYTQHNIQEMASTKAEPVGKSGRRYFIERVLQEKGIPARRVYLATYVLLELNCQHYLSC